MKLLAGFVSMNRKSCTKTGLICVAVAAQDAVGVKAAVRQVHSLVDVVEVRLDAMTVPQVDQCCDLLSMPLLFTNRPAWEGGRFQGADAERIEALMEAVNRKAAFVDFELRADPKLRRRLLAAIDDTSTRMIISCHDFEKTPTLDQLGGILQQMMESGAHIGKIVTTAHDFGDVLRVLNLQIAAADRDFPLCAFCMGEAGRISRLATLYLGGFMTYAALSDEEATAPGQLSVSALRDLMQTLWKGA